MAPRAWLLAPLALLPPGASAHYGQPPCQPDEVQGEIQGASGYACAPRCQADMNCPLDIPAGANAQPQCMLQDLNRQSWCGLLCSVDAQCPTGLQCKRLKQLEVGVCLSPISFTDWAHGASSVKLAVGWPAGQGGAMQSFMVQRTQAALNNMKAKFNINDADADMQALNQFMAGLQQQGAAPAAQPAQPLSAGQFPGGVPPAGPTIGQALAQSPGMPPAMMPAATPAAAPAHVGGGVLTHDIMQAENYWMSGIPGIEREVHDTVWNAEHLDRRYAATNMVTGLIWLGVLYVGIGALIKYQEGARGVDLMPHRSFWSEYPSLVNDGVLYAKILLGLQRSNDFTLSGGLPKTTIGRSEGAGTFEAL